jgi:hypothetical protein
MSYQSNPDTVDTTATGTLGALNATVVLLTSGVGTGIFEITGSWVGTITFQGSNNAFTTSQAITAIYLGGIQTQSATTTTNGFFTVVTAGFAQVRAIMTAYTSGSATILANGSSADRIVVPLQGNPNNNQTLATLNTGTNSIGSVTQTDTAATGTISATDVLGGTPNGTGGLISTAPTASSFVSFALPGGTSQLDVQILGTATGTYYFEYSLDSTTGSDGSWVTGLFRQSGINNTVLVLGATANGIYRGAAAGFKYFRLRNVGGTTPSNAITARVSNGSGVIFLNASIPTGSNTIGAVTGPAAAPLALDATLTGGTAKTKLVDSGGTNLATVKAASTAAVAADPSLVVSVSPNNTVAVTQATAANLNATVVNAAGSALMGKVGIDQTTVGTTNAVSIAQLGANTIATGNGTSSTGTLRVALASDQTTNTNPLLTKQVATTTTSGILINKVITAANTTPIQIKTSAGALYGWTMVNTSTTIRYVRFYNVASAPTMGTTSPAFVIPLPVGSGAVMPIMDLNIPMGTGIFYSITTGAADLDNTAPAANDVVGTIWSI